jgi:hypothetical protein
VTRIGGGQERRKDTTVALEATVPVTVLVQVVLIPDLPSSSFLCLLAGVSGVVALLGAGSRCSLLCRVQYE